MNCLWWCCVRHNLFFLPIIVVYRKTWLNKKRLIFCFVHCVHFLSKQAEIQSNPFYRRNPLPESERSFHIGLHLPTGGRNSFNKLMWLHHSCHTTYRWTKDVASTRADKSFPCWCCTKWTYLWSLSGWLERRLLQPSTWTACTHPFTLHVWGVILPPRSNLCELFWKPSSKGSLQFAQIPANGHIWSLPWCQVCQTLTLSTCKHVTFQVHNTAYFLISEIIIIWWKLNNN